MASPVFGSYSTDSCSSIKLLPAVCATSPVPPSVLQSSKSIQQAALSLWWVYIGILLVTTSTFYHGKREVLEAKFQKSSTCVIPPYNFSAIQRAMVMTFPAESGCQPRVGKHSSLNFLSKEITISPFICYIPYQVFLIKLSLL